jgi:hypothetical protein
MSFLKNLFRRRRGTRTANPDLLKNLVAFQRNPTPKVREQLYRSLLRSTPIVALAEAPPAALTAHFSIGESTVLAPENLNLPFVGARDPDGATYAVAFTDMESMLHWNPDAQHYLGIPATTLLGIMAANAQLGGLAINPSSAAAGWFTAPECATLARGEVPGYQDEKISTSPLEKGTRIGFRAPASPPEGLADALRDQCQQYPDIQAAYLLEMTVGDAPPQLTVALDCAPPPSTHRKGQLTQLLGKATEPILSAKMDIAFLFLESPQLLSMARQLPEFYRGR